MELAKAVTAFPNLKRESSEKSPACSTINISKPSSTESCKNILPHNYHNATPEEKEILDKALSTFTYISESIYIVSAKSDIKSEIMLCQCSMTRDSNNIKTCCGEDSDCINRLLFMECLRGVCPGSKYCQNQRFQRQLNSPIKLIEVSNKGYGIEAAENFGSGQFVMEYVGEVISHKSLLRRSLRYTEQGAKHFYFMSLESDKIIDATTTGSLARFINHSCNPNCILQKWIVGSRIRVGIFTNRAIKAGEELTFDYKFEQYGAVAQKCYCGEANCKGTLGSEKSIEQREQAELNRYFFGKRLRGLDNEKQCTKLISLMLQLNQEQPEKALPLLEKLCLTEDTGLLKLFIRSHGIVTLKSWLTLFKNHEEIGDKILSILSILPFSCKNKLIDAEIFSALKEHASDKSSSVKEQINDLISRWEALPKKYIIPRLTNSNTSTDTPSPEKGPITPQPETSFPPDSNKRKEAFSEDTKLPKQSRNNSLFYKGPPRQVDSRDKGFSGRFRRSPRSSGGFQPPRHNHPQRFEPENNPPVRDFRNDYSFQDREHHDPNQNLYRDGLGGYNPNPYYEPKGNPPASSYNHHELPGPSMHYRSGFKPVFSGPSYLHPLVPPPNSFGSIPPMDSNLPPLRVDFPPGMQIHPSYSALDFPHDQANPPLSYSLHPPSLPVDWLSAETPEGQTYYYHRVTMETTWDHPSQFSAPSGSVSSQSNPSTKIISDKPVQIQNSKGSGPNTGSTTVPERTKKPLSELYTKAKGFSEIFFPKHELPSRCKKMFSKEVVNVFTPYSSHFDKAFFKKHAERMTVMLVDKELRESCYQHGYFQVMNSTLRAKIYDFVKHYADRLVEKKVQYEKSKKDLNRDHLAPAAV